MVVTECGKCRFYVTTEYEVEDVSYTPSCGFCRRYPPRRIDGATSGFPVVEDDWWCGEYKKVSKDRM